MKSVLISIRPKWRELIASGKKNAGNQEDKAET